jgi:hypothetical protein
MKYILSIQLVVLLVLTFALSGQAQTSDAGPNGGAKITLTVGDQVIPAILYNSAAAKDLMAKLPVTVSLNRGPVDYCGGIDPIKYGEGDAQTGYRSGDLAYWIPGQDFVIFTETKEAASNSADFVIVGQVRTDIEKIKNLGGTIKVTIALSE